MFQLASNGPPDLSRCPPIGQAGVEQRIERLSKRSVKNESTMPLDF